MALPFSMTGVDELFVTRDGYSGFDRPGFARLVGILGSGSSTGDQVIQSGALPLRQATISGVSYDAADVATLRGYHESKEVVDFTDGDGVDYRVVVFDFSAKSFTGKWTYSMTLLAMDGVTLIPSPVAVTLGIPVPTVIVPTVTVSPAPVEAELIVPTPTVTAS